MNFLKQLFQVGAFYKMYQLQVLNLGGFFHFFLNLNELNIRPARLTFFKHPQVRLQVLFKIKVQLAKSVHSPMARLHVDTVH